MRNPYLLLAISIALGAIGQICLKTGALRTETNHSLLSFFEPVLLTGLSVYFISALLYIVSLKQLPLSVAFPSVSLSYVLVSLLAHLIWKEPFGARQLLSLVLIASGVFFLNSK